MTEEPAFDPYWSGVVNRLACEVLGHKKRVQHQETVNLKFFVWTACPRCSKLWAGRAPSISDYLLETYKPSVMAEAVMVASPFARHVLRNIRFTDQDLLD